MNGVAFPARWTKSRMKYVSSLKGRLGWQGLKAEEYRQDGPFVVSSAHFRNDRIVWDLCPHVSWERYRLDANIQLQEGDVLLMKDGAALGKLAFLDHLPGPACLNSHLLLFRPRRDAYYPKFLYYYMSTTFFQKYILIRGTGATFLGVSQETIGNYELTLPPPGEQRAIVCFLDRETARIDALVAKNERLIELLMEKRIALITHAVTKGLDPSVPMKESGVEWLGRIPAHWECLALARVTLARCDGPFGSNLKSEHYSVAGVRVIRLQNIGWTEFLGSDAAYIGNVYADQLGDHGVIAGDLLIAGLGDEGHPVGRACSAPRGIEPAMVKADCFRFRLDARHLWSQFAAYQLSAVASAAAGTMATGATRSRMNLTAMAARKVALPPVDEQRAIVAILDRHGDEHRKLAQRVRDAIERLNELRIALISAAVTGKIDIREVA